MTIAMHTERKAADERLHAWDRELPALSRLIRRMRATDSLTASKLSALQIVIDLVQTDLGEAGVDAQQLTAVVEVIAGRIPGPVRRGEHLSADAFVRLANEVKHTIEVLRAGRGWRAPELRRLVLPAPKDRLVIHYLGDLRSRFINAVVDVIVPEFHRIHRCERSGCGRWFVKRKRARYCSKYCQQKVMSDRFFSAMSDSKRSEYAHGLYRKRVEKRDGPAVASKVERRRKPMERR